MLSLLGALALTPGAHAFCGTFVGEPGATITNSTSQVLLARQGDLTTLTMVNDFAGDPSDFALVVPVPQVLSEDDVRTVIPELVEEAERYSGPRLVEYTCEDFYSYYSPSRGCGTRMYDMAAQADTGAIYMADEDSGDVVIEAEFEAGEYSVVILSAEESGSLLSWLDRNGYGVSPDTEDLLQEAIDAGSYFLAAQVHYEMIPPDNTTLSPLQIRYESPMLSLPIRLGASNSPGAQELVVYAITAADEGQLHISNYPEATLTDECMVEVSPEDFGAWYGARLDEALPTESGTEAHWILEHSWSPYHCDPCVDGEALPDWVVQEAGWEGESFDATFSRLRIRYSPEQATQDLVFNQSGIQDRVQQRYIRYELDFEDRFPLCNLDANTADMVEDPQGSCDEAFAEWDKENRRAERQEDGALGCASAQDRAPAAGAALAWLLLSGLVRRKRRSAR
ncbi:MAG: DUF2330 domain-containing protein [Alphaproteobacteria bacterium]|nr:DUF2330 domain-containing protein [Alphaproteobacteria bacterium]